MRLEQIVKRLHTDALPLDEHLALVQDGWAHAHAVRMAIQATALSVDHLGESAGGIVVRERKAPRSWPQGEPT